MKIYLCGQKSFGAAALRLLAKLGHQVVGVSSPPYHNERLRDGTGGESDRPDPLRCEAARLGVPWMAAGILRERTVPTGLDLIVAAHSHDYLSRQVRQATRLGAVGYHPSLLPLHRGRDAVRWAVKMRERVTGGTVYWFDDRVDAGPVAAQGWCFIRPGDDASELWKRELFPMGLRLIERVVTDLATGTMVAIPQDETLATWEPALNPPRLHRPDLPAIGRLEGMKVVAMAEEIPGPALARMAMYGIDAGG